MYVCMYVCMCIYIYTHIHTLLCVTPVRSEPICFTPMRIRGERSHVLGKAGEEAQPTRTNCFTRPRSSQLSGCFFLVWETRTTKPGEPQATITLWRLDLKPSEPGAALGNQEPGTAAEVSDVIGSAGLEPRKCPCGLRLKPFGFRLEDVPFPCMHCSFLGRLGLGGSASRLQDSRPFDSEELETQKEECNSAWVQFSISMILGNIPMPKSSQRGQIRFAAPSESRNPTCKP